MPQPQQTILQTLNQSHSAHKKSFALLIDPDNTTVGELPNLLTLAHGAGVVALLVGGSLIVNSNFGSLIAAIRADSHLPIIIFPGSNHHIDARADGILLLSLISGRNPDFLIGQHVIAAPMIKKSGLEVLPTGYILIDGGAPTTVSYISGTQPIPADKPAIAACTALAGAQLGLQLIYLDAGSGAAQPITPKLIAAVRREVDIPLIVGGGIRTAHEATKAWQAGADLIVVGNAIEADTSLITAIGAAAAQLNSEPSLQSVL